MRWIAPAAAFLATMAALLVLVPAPFAAPGEAIEGVQASAGKGISYFDAASPPALRYTLRARGPVDLRVQLVRRDDGRIVQGWLERAVQPGQRQELRWDGRDDEGEVADDGAYKFSVKAAGAARLAAVAKLEFRDHVFPIPGPHSYRDGLGDFGAPRPGRIHEGKDVWAGCGEDVLAARGGRVQRTGYDDELYGNFVVIDGRATDVDYFYVHLLHPASVGEGDRVHTGDLIGLVGASGNARDVGCMLHLEMWPDGFRHGAPEDPEPFLRAWDAWS